MPYGRKAGIYSLRSAAEDALPNHGYYDLVWCNNIDDALHQWMRACTRTHKATCDLDKLGASLDAVSDSKESISSPHIQLVLADEEDACSDTCNKGHGCYHPLVEPVDEKAARKFTLSPCFTKRGQGFVFNPEASVQCAVRSTSHGPSVKSKASTPSKRRKVKAHDVSPPRHLWIPQTPYS
ncbi:hypothetical protein K438DRAFT_1966004 [Mycena galopus ATCC 62051]|nr:hypothetical protein K438DRAFT_1966004 [Mycena galopus ATCC 62051]